MSDEFRNSVARDAWTVVLARNPEVGIEDFKVVGNAVLDVLAAKLWVRNEWALALQNGLQLPMYQAAAVQATLGRSDTHQDPYEGLVEEEQA